MAMLADYPGWLDGNLQPSQSHNLQALGVGSAKPLMTPTNARCTEMCLEIVKPS